MSQATLPDRLIVYRQYYLVALWLESLLYGIYLCLALTTLVFMSWRGDKTRTTSSQLIMGAIAGMFVLISLQAFSDLYRLLVSYSGEPLIGQVPAEPLGVNYLLDWPVVWDYLMFTIIVTMLGWIADVIMIYRCFVVWQRRFRFIVASLALFIISLASGAYSIYWFKHPLDSDPRVAQVIIGLYFPVSLAQNALTTGLISYRIWCQHRRNMRCLDLATSDPGISQGSGEWGRPSLTLVVRILIESALIWTVTMLIVTVLFYIDHPAEVIAVRASIPISGIVFLLVALRTQALRAHEASGPSTLSAFGPQFQDGSWEGSSTTTKELV